MRYALACMMLLLVAACSNDPEPTKNRGDDSGSRDSGRGIGDSRDSGSGKDSGSGSTGKTDGGGATGKDGGGSSVGKDSGSGSGKDGGSGTGTGKKFETAMARTDIEGKVTDFKHVMALWDETNHSVRFVASTEAIPADKIKQLRNGDALEGETPHVILSFVLEEGTTSLGMKGVENWFFGFHNLTSLSPMNLMNIGKETIVEFSGKPKVGETIRLYVEFRSEKVKDAPAEKIHFDFAQEIELK
ncbi:MAG: hypothetical protein IT462_11165 [Planctomycetes bacterium]|nr:hypothetical protein [Planctomycetota bacterium]